ncbi:multidrug effflux MFS transporter [Glutamicibacter endophyticus]|uniref:multidrug effflux MFS transporter n=1 Tax=Glutamicibacter endophyticus TaxID=1522174 RepID=UPI003AF15C67
MSARAEHSKLTPILFILLVVLGTTGPLAVDMYLPSFPAMATQFGASATRIQLTLTAFLLGMAAGQLLWGPLSDRLGRALPLRLGTGLFVLTSVGAALAPTLESLIAARALQGLGAAAGLVISKAIVADTTSGVRTARMFSILMTIGGVAPAVAPILGSFIAQIGGFRAVLWTLAAVAAIMCTGCLAFYKETLPLTARSSGRYLAPLRQAISRPRFVGYMLQFAFGFACMMAYVSASPFVYQNVMGLSPRLYALAFGVNALGLIAAGFTSARLATRVPLRRTISVALSVMLGASLLLLILVLLGVRSLALAAVIFILVASIGFTTGNTTGLALAEVREVSGSGSALLGAAQFAVGAMATPLVGMRGENSALGLAVVLLCCAAVSFAALIYTADRFHSDSAGLTLPARS